MECRAYGICLDSQSRGYLGKDRKVSSAAGGNLSRMHKTEETAKESRLNFMYSHLRNRTLASGPKTVFTPPNYSPPPNDQRVDDAVESARQAKAKLDEQQKVLAEQINKDNALRGQLETQITANQLLADQLKAAFDTQKQVKRQDNAPETDAQKAAEGAADGLADWGKQVGKSIAENFYDQPAGSERTN